MADDQIQPEPLRGPASRRGEEEIQGHAPRRARDEHAEREDRRARQREREEDEDEIEDRIRRKDDGLATLIPYRNPMALASYYCGVFALIPCIGVVLGIASVILGIFGLVYYKKHPTARGVAHAIVGIVLGALVLMGHLALVVLGLTGAFK
jgi:hypothetical protein